MIADFSILTASVDRLHGTVESAVELIRGLATMIQECKHDPSALQVIVDKLNQQATTLAAAVASNPLPAVGTVPPIEAPPVTGEPVDAVPPPAPVAAPPREERPTRPS